MASKIQIKRSSVAGKLPNTSNLSTGELALNLSDGRLFSSDGARIFEIGANVASLTVNGSITFPIYPGSNNQILVSDDNGTLTFRKNIPTFVSDSAPSNPENGQIWFDADDEIAYIYYDEPGNARWVNVTGSGGVSSGVSKKQSVLYSLMFG
tara:strand:- start:6649 stop:7104 length:456 start_codon:yes stop_codon:yes gene_type:complete